MNFHQKIEAAIKRGQEAKKIALHSSMSAPERLEVASQISFMIDDLDQLEKLYFKQVRRVLQCSAFTPSFF